MKLGLRWQFRLYRSYSIDIPRICAGKAIKGEKENGGKVEVKWFFTKWNEFKFQGDLDDAVIETK